ncbi:hypothetical protein IX339_000092 [Porphyromonas levii]|uniref:DUF4254 domain-containing protein n=1 Tax=Porphyromonas levii TaxID=28114 RepID=UPI001B8C0E51|nr:DUF4254 domain-containing protein [Porphyromonas levii]MBR8730662.1 hypothetical protein [Porphyromonas levii]MBR8758660.1 hypothetical protein [Porphyromonas levii]
METIKDFSRQAIAIFDQAIEDYHVRDNVNAEINNPYAFKSIEYYLYLKCWIDTVQWHMEDIMRDPDIDPAEALATKRKIDRNNQERTDLVELIDSYLLDRFYGVKVLPDATINTESPAWAIDRLSILQLKIYHMRGEAERPGTDEHQRMSANAKLSVLIQQNTDLITAIDTLLQDIEAGRKQIKVYKQMKMYNDPNLNPVLYNRRKQS